ncbi:Sporulation protein RMD8, partial [Teratosphaeria destructans]
ATRGAKSDAERLPKSQRNAEAQLARVTAYCTAQSYRVRATATFVREQHGAKTKLYDDCLYCVYSLPLLGGSDGYRVRSSPVLKNPGGRSILDEQIEANERRQYREGWQEDSDEYSVQVNENPYANTEHDDPRERDPEEQRRHDEDTARSDGWKGEQDDAGSRRESNSSGNFSFPSPGIGVNPEAYSVGELFVYAYGVVVFWNFTENQEKDILADLTFCSSSALNNTSSPSGPTKLAQKLTGKKPSRPSPSQKLPSLTPLTPSIPLMTRPLDEDDFETEDFHFQYDVHAEKPRIYNDMITLRTSDHMIKLAMSHAIGQSTKLSFFEERMQRTMAEAQYVPRRLALEGRLGMGRKEVVALVGRLFEQRVDVNLSSNMLDTPTFFWDSEPTLHPLYQAVREYLEIKPRIQVLNERCRVFLDLAEILSDSIADVKMTRITWIIIVLIVLSIAVTCTEVFLRFGILAKGKGGEGRAMMRGVEEL